MIPPPTVHPVKRWRDLGGFIIPFDTTEKELAVTLFSALRLMCEYLPENARLNPEIDSACHILGHPDSGQGKCYCRSIFYK